MAASPARVSALSALTLIATTCTDLGDALARTRDQLTDNRDRALATELITGTLRWRGAIDYQLAQLSGRRLAKLDPAVLNALRLGAYQLLYLDRVPVSAVVNDSVTLVKTGGFKSASGFVNAVLRRLARERESLTWPSRDDLVKHLAVVHSHPEWLVERWVTRYGETAAEQWLAFNNRPPPITLGTNRLRVTRGQLAERLAAEGITTRPTTHSPHGLVVIDGQPLRSQAFRDGDCLVQDEASQLIPELSMAPLGARVLDACAAPGGKTVALAAQAGVRGLVVATDVRARRMRILRETLSRCRISRALPVQVGARDGLPFRDRIFDHVLIDAPCSGLGTVRRDPDIRWRRQPEDLGALAVAQLDLLIRFSALLRPGGTLVYSTCSSEPEENEEVVEAFLATSPDYVLCPVSQLDIAANLQSLSTSKGHLRTLPHRDGLEAFFGVVLRRCG